MCRRGTKFPAQDNGDKHYMYVTCLLWLCACTAYAGWNREVYFTDCYIDLLIIINISSTLNMKLGAKRVRRPTSLRGN